MNNMDNYIVVNGKKAELTDEQLKALGIEVKKKRNNPFGEIENNTYYFYIGANDTIVSTVNINTVIDKNIYITM